MIFLKKPIWFCKWTRVLSVKLNKSAADSIFWFDLCQFKFFIHSSLQYTQNVIPWVLVLLQMIFPGLLDLISNTLKCFITMKYVSLKVSFCYFRKIVGNFYLLYKLPLYKKNPLKYSCDGPLHWIEVNCIFNKFKLYAYYFSAFSIIFFSKFLPEKCTHFL